MHGLFWTQQHDSLLRYYAQEADYIFETDSTEDIINLQTPQGIFAFVTKSLSKSLKGDLKAGNVELIMQAADATPYYDAQTRNYVGKVPIKERWSHECYDWKWEKAVASPESKGMKYKTIFFAKKMEGIDKAFRTTNAILMKPIFAFSMIERGHIILTREITNAPKIIFIPQRNISIEATLKCTQEARRIFTTEQDLYTYLGTLKGR
ncbi:MAG: hypothetical protein IPL35_06345 [Sphingobacteriales bacterium]|nr:hypothetical protein [Sphingobacteriales bacterium]